MIQSSNPGAAGRDWTATQKRSVPETLDTPRNTEALPQRVVAVDQLSLIFVVHSPTATRHAVRVCPSPMTDRCGMRRVMGTYEWRAKRAAERNSGALRTGHAPGLAGSPSFQPPRQLFQLLHPAPDRRGAAVGQHLPERFSFRRRWPCSLSLAERDT
jgi:hypothetical protein